MGIWLVNPQRAGTPVPIGVEEGWVSPDYARKLPAPVLVANAEGAGDQMFVTVLAPLDGEAAVDWNASHVWSPTGMCSTPPEPDLTS